MSIPRAASLVLELVENLPSSQVLGIAELLMDGKLDANLPAPTVEDLTDAHGSSLRPLIALLRKWEGEPSSLASALVAAVETQRISSQSSDKASLVWTGPTDFEVRAQTTLSTAKEMITAAKNLVVILGYVVTPGAKPLFELLAEKQGKGVRIQLIIDKAREQLPLVTRLWPAKKLPEIYESRTRLHAKIIVIDHKDMLVTSANLTYSGLRTNIEIGARITGRVALQTSDLVSKLIDEEQFFLLTP